MTLFRVKDPDSVSNKMPATNSSFQLQKVIFARCWCNTPRMLHGKLRKVMIDLIWLVLILCWTYLPYTSSWQTETSDQENSPAFVSSIPTAWCKCSTTDSSIHVLHNADNLQLPYARQPYSQNKNQEARNVNHDNVQMPSNRPMR